MEESVKSKFDVINFIYGVGAAVILIAAMFKFLGWSYANEIFIVGLTTEAIVFLISAFQWRIIKKDYSWEKVFPVLKTEKEGKDTKIDLTDSIQTYYKNTESILKSVQGLDSTIQNMTKASQQLSDSITKITGSMNKIENSSNSYEQELNNMKAKMMQVNEFYSEMANMVSKK